MDDKISLLLPDPKHPEYVEAKLLESDTAILLDPPAFSGTYGFGDVVRVEMRETIPTAVEPIKQSGWSTFGLLARRVDPENIKAALKRLEDSGCIVVSREERLFSIAAPPGHEAATQNILEMGGTLGIWIPGILLDRRTRHNHHAA